MNTPAWHTVWARRKWTAMQCTDQKTELVAHAETKWYGKRDVQFTEGDNEQAGAFCGCQRRLLLPPITEIDYERARSVRGRGTFASFESCNGSETV